MCGYDSCLISASSFYSTFKPLKINQLIDSVGKLKTINAIIPQPQGFLGNQSSRGITYQINTTFEIQRLIPFSLFDYSLEMELWKLILNCRSKMEHYVKS